MSTNTWLHIICAMQINAVLFGLGAVIVLVSPAMAADAKIWIPLVVVLSFVLALILARFIAPRLRLRYWRKRGQRGDAISGY